MSTREDGIKTFHASDRERWRQWLIDNHEKESSVWLILYKKASKTPSVTYKEAVEEALCFGWIDSKPNKRDEESYFQYFSQRKATSNWSLVNKTTVEKLLRENKMFPKGLAMVELAKQTGTWDALNDVDNLIVPDDLQAALDALPDARTYFDAFPPSARRGILEWIFNAKRPETRAKRVQETARLASCNIRANQFNSKS